MTTDDPSALDQAASELNGLIETGPPADQVIAAVGALVAGWADEADMSREIMLDRVERLWDGITTQAAALQEQLADSENGTGPEHARGQRVLVALNAAAATLAAVSAR